jgi:hypothetical protein
MRTPDGTATPDAAISWPLAGPVSPCPPPESVSASLMSETAGLRSRMPLASYDRGSSSWKIPQLALQLTEEPIGLAPCVIWPHSGSMLAGSVYELPRPALPIGGTGSGASAGVPWTTPQAHDAAPGRAERIGRHGTKHGGRDLTDEVAATEWPTPIASDGDKGPVRYSRGNAGLALAVKEWPTPTAADSHGHAQTKENPTPGQTGGTTLMGAITSEWPTPTAQTYGTNQGGSAGRVGPVRPSLEAAAKQWSTPTATDGDGRGIWKNREASPHATQGGKPRLSEDLGSLLNPRWVEALMGWPIGFLGLPSEVAGPLLAALRKKPGSRRAPADASPVAPTS